MRERTKKQTPPAAIWILKILLAMYIVSGLLLVILSVLVSRVEQEELTANVGVIVVYVVSCALGGFLAGRMRGERKFLWGLLLGVIYFAVLLAVSLVISGGEIPDGMHLVTTLAICAGSGMAGGMIG